MNRALIRVKTGVAFDENFPNLKLNRARILHGNYVNSTRIKSNRRTKAPSTRIRKFFDPQFSRCGLTFRPHVFHEYG